MYVQCINIKGNSALMVEKVKDFHVHESSLAMDNPIQQEYNSRTTLLYLKICFWA